MVYVLCRYSFSRLPVLSYIYPAKNNYQILCILTTVRHIGIPIYTQHRWLGLPQVWGWPVTSKHVACADVYNCVRYMFVLALRDAFFQFLNINFNIILPSTTRSSKWSLSLRSPGRSPAWTSPVSDTCHMPCPSHSSFRYPSDVWWSILIIQTLPALSC